MYKYHRYLFTMLKNHYYDRVFQIKQRFFLTSTDIFDDLGTSFYVPGLHRSGHLFRRLQNKVRSNAKPVYWVPNLMQNQFLEFHIWSKIKLQRPEKHVLDLVSKSEKHTWRRRSKFEEHTWRTHSISCFRRSINLLRLVDLMDSY